MKTNLNVDGFVQYAESTGKYNENQLEIIARALYTLEDDCAALSWKDYGLYSVDYINKNLTQCCRKIVGYMMTCGMKQAKATAAANDFKKWMKMFD